MHRSRTRIRPRLRKSLALLTGGLLTAATLALGAPGASASGPVSPAATDAAAAAGEDFQQVTLAKGAAETGEPMSLAVLPDRSVLHTSRSGELRITDSAGNTKVSGVLPVYSHDEEGLQGVGIDPDFDKNRAIYLYYAPPLDTPSGDAPETGTAADFAKFDGVNRLSRFVLKEDGTLDLSSEKKVLDVKTSRGICCHVGGDIDFDAQGNLYLSTGDDSNPFASDGYTPIDERPDRNPAFDARRTSGNTNDLRGKILRIKVADDGSYTIPEGNLFAPGTDKTRPEIYAMGFRNPFRFSVDKATGIAYVGDYGPDAGAADPKRGPGGQVEFARVTKAGNFGWPFCTGKNDPFVDYDFATKTSGAAFDCAAPKNTSPHNTGLVDLPPAQPAWIPYDGGSVPEFGTGSESPMGGPVYHYDADLDSPVKFPEAYDGDFFAGEFGRQWIKRIEQDGDGNVQSINDIPWSGTQVMDMAFGPDGALYVLDYGVSWFGGDEHSALYRIENATGGHSPVAEASSNKTSGTAPLKVQFSSAGTTDSDNDALTYAWDFGDGGTSTAANPTYTYKKNGTYTATVTAKDPTGRTGSASVHVTVGNTAPKVNLELPGDGQLFSFGDDDPVQGDRHRPRGRHHRLLQGPGQLRTRPRQPRPPDHHGTRLLRHHQDRDGRRTRPERQHLRSHRRLVHRRRRRRPGRAQRPRPVAAPAPPPAGRALHRVVRHQDVRQGERGGRQDGRRHRQRRLDRLQAVHPRRLHQAHRPDLVRRRGRLPRSTVRLRDRQDPRLRTGSGDRRLGELPGHRRTAARRPEAGHRTLPGLQGRRRGAVRHRRLRALQQRARPDRQAGPGLLEDGRLPPRRHPRRASQH